MPTPPSAASDGIARSADLGRQTRPVHSGQAGDSAAMLMEQVVQRENLLAAYERVRANKGAAGVDGMTVDDLADFCRGHWPRIREQLLGGVYVPQPVRKVEIPKPDGKGVRLLGIPTVLDRLIQQALLQARNWRSGATGSYGTPTTATCTSGADWQASVCWPRWKSSSRSVCD